MIQFFQTHMGRKFIEGDIPRIAKSLEGIHEEMRRANDLAEQQMNDNATKSAKNEEKRRIHNEAYNSTVNHPVALGRADRNG